jgi:5-methylcytosine-specific restriction endonuclease McrA
MRQDHLPQRLRAERRGDLREDRGEEVNRQARRTEGQARAGRTKCGPCQASGVKTNRLRPRRVQAGPTRLSYRWSKVGHRRHHRRRTNRSVQLIQAVGLARSPAIIPRKRGGRSLPSFSLYVIWHTDRRHEGPVCSLAFRCVRGSNMHQAEYLAHTVASLMMQRAELQRLREAVEAAEGSSLRGSGEKVEVGRRRARPTVMRGPSSPEITVSRL